MNVKQMLEKCNSLLDEVSRINRVTTNNPIEVVMVDVKTANIYDYCMFAKLTAYLDDELTISVKVTNKDTLVFLVTIKDELEDEAFKYYATDTMSAISLIDMYLRSERKT